MKSSRGILVGGAPFIHDGVSTAGNAWWTIAVLLPCLAWGGLMYGWRAVAVVGVSILSAVLGDWLQSLTRRRFELSDGTAALTGILTGFSMPATVPFIVPAAAALFAILVVKGAFGGLGNNWMNPALAGIAFAWMNWPEAMGRIPDSLDFGGLPAQVDSMLTSALNSFPFSFLGTTLPDGYAGPFLGLRTGSIGELPGIWLLAASAILIARRIVRWQVPAAIFFAFAGLEWIFGGTRTGGGFFSGDALKAVMNGSFLLVAFFMATDPVTSPSRRLPMAIFGISIGAFAFLFRAYGSSGAYMAFAVIIVNCLVPALERLHDRRVEIGRLR